MLLRDQEFLVAAPEAPRVLSRVQELPPAAPHEQRDDTLVDGIEDSDFCSLLLAALATMAAKSKRRQADLDAALARAKLRASPERIRAALRHLRETACIREIVPLYDGGLLLTVTNIGMDTLGRAADWRFLQQIVGRTH